jgi:hypothetical protein
MTFGQAPIKGEGMIADPDEFTFECDCEKCKAKYLKWKHAFNAQQEAMRMAKEQKK